MVCRIPFDPNPRHPHHQNSEDSVHREPRKPRAHCDDGDHLHGRNDVTLHLGGFGIRFFASSLVLLAAARDHAGDIRHTHPPRKSLVHSQVGTLRRTGQQFNGLLASSVRSLRIPRPPRGSVIQAFANLSEINDRGRSSFLSSLDATRIQKCAAAGHWPLK